MPFVLRTSPPGTNEDAVVTKLTEVGFDHERISKAVSELSGGWRMKLAIARSMFFEKELLLLDEPTNHLDRPSVEWLQDYLVNHLPGITVLVVSHDYEFLTAVCTDVVHIANKHLGYFTGGFKKFQEERPEIVAALPKMKDLDNNVTAKIAEVVSEEAKETKVIYRTQAEEDAAKAAAKLEQMMSNPSENVNILPMNFPDPGKLDGISALAKVVMKMDKVSYAYAGTDKMILNEASVKLSRSSRVGLVGPNGAGKTTLLRLLIGDLDVAKGVGEVWKHHNLRVSYIAQHSAHHLEEHVDKSALDYITIRFKEGQVLLSWQSCAFEL